MPDPADSTYDKASLTYDELHVNFDGGDPLVEVPRGKPVSVQDYLGIGTSRYRR